MFSMFELVIIVNILPNTIEKMIYIKKYKNTLLFLYMSFFSEKKIYNIPNNIEIIIIIPYIGKFILFITIGITTIPVEHNYHLNLYKILKKTYSYMYN